MKGKVISFRRSLKHIHKRHFILNFGSKNREEALKLVGSEVEWRSPAGKILKGKISSAHGNKGLVRAIFERGLPGQAIATDIEMGSVKETKKPAKEEKKVKIKKEAKK